MATDYKAVDITARTFPFQQTRSFNATRYTTVPWGQAIVNEVIETPAVGVGNDGLMKIDVELPGDYVAMLRNFQFQLSDAATVNWGENGAVLGMAYQQPGGPYLNTVASYSEDEYTWFQMVSDQITIKDRFGTNISYRSFAFGMQGNNDRPYIDSAIDPTQIPLWIPPTADSSFKERQLIFYVGCASDGQPAQTSVIRASFDLYTFDQAYSAAVMSSPRVFT